MQLHSVYDIQLWIQSLPVPLLSMFLVKFLSYSLLCYEILILSSFFFLGQEVSSKLTCLLWGPAFGFVLTEQSLGLIIRFLWYLAPVCIPDGPVSLQLLSPVLWNPTFGFARCVLWDPVPFFVSGYQEVWNRSLWSCETIRFVVFVCTTTFWANHSCTTRPCSSVSDEPKSI